METLIGSGQLVAVLGVLVAICSVMMPVAVVFVVLHFRHRHAAETLATVRELADKGVPIPPGLLRPSERDRRRFDPRSTLMAGVTTLGAGIGLMIFFYTSGLLRWLWGVGALVAIVGIAQLIVLWLVRKMPNDDVGNDAR
jgi:hypothetical protein